MSILRGNALKHHKSNISALHHVKYGRTLLVYNKIMIWLHKTPTLGGHNKNKVQFCLIKCHFEKITLIYSVLPLLIVRFVILKFNISY